VQRTFYLIVSLVWAFSVFAQEDPRLRGNHYNITDFSGGYITDYDILDVDPKFSSWICNLEIDKGRLSLRKGYSIKFNFEESLAGCPAMWDSAFSQVGRISDVFSYTISSPSRDSLRALAGNVGEVFVAAGLDTVETSIAYIWHMYPSYVPNDSLGKGGWRAEWSKDYNMPNSTTPGTANYMNAPGRGDRLRWSDPLDFCANSNVLRAAAGSRNSADTTWTWPIWFGPITRYRWNVNNKLDNFYLYKATLENDILDTNTVISMSAVDISTPPGDLPNGRDPVDGRYWVKIAVEYDGYQYSIPKGDSTWFVDLVNPDTDMIQITCKFDSLILNARYTALIIFTTDPMDASDGWFTTGGFVEQTTSPAVGRTRPGWQPGPTIGPGIADASGQAIDWGNLLYYFRKRVVISDIDTSKIGYQWKENGGGGRVGWTASGDSMKIDIWIDADDIEATQLEMWDYLGHNSAECSVMPLYQNMVGGQIFAGNVLIDGPESKIKENYANMVIVSTSGQPDLLPVNNFILVGVGSGSYITGIEEWMGNAIIFTNDALEVWAPGDPPQRIEQYVGRGCNAPLSIQITPYGVFYANHNGIMVYDGERPKVISRFIETSFDSCNVINAVSDLNTVEYGVGVYFPKDDQYGFFCNTIGTSELDTLYISTNWELNLLDGQSAICGNGSVPGWWLNRYGGGATGGGGGGGGAGTTPYGGHGGGYIYNMRLDAWTRWSFSDGFSRFIKGSNDAIYGLVAGDSSRQYLCQMKTNPLTGGEPPVEYYLDAGGYYPGIWESGWTDFGLPGVEKSDVEGIMLDYYTEADSASNDLFTMYLYNEGYSLPYDTLLYTQIDSSRHFEYEEPDAQPVRTNINQQNPVIYNFRLISADSCKSEINSIKIVYKPKKLREY